MGPFYFQILRLLGFIYFFVNSLSDFQTKHNLRAPLRMEICIICVVNPSAVHCHPLRYVKCGRARGKDDCCVLYCYCGHAYLSAPSWPICQNLWKTTFSYSVQLWRLTHSTLSPQQAVVKSMQHVTSLTTQGQSCTCSSSSHCVN